MRARPGRLPGDEAERGEVVDALCPGRQRIRFVSVKAGPRTLTKTFWRRFSLIA